MLRSTPEMIRRAADGRVVSCFGVAVDERQQVVLLKLEEGVRGARFIVLSAMIASQLHDCVGRTLSHWGLEIPTEPPAMVPMTEAERMAKHHVARALHFFANRANAEIAFVVDEKHAVLMAFVAPARVLCGLAAVLRQAFVEGLLHFTDRGDRPDRSN